MVYVEKSQPAPASLEIEKQKANGKYNNPDVLERLDKDFKNKCYICEQEGPTDINVEHFIPHKSNIDLKFDWNNLYFACGHCNNTKLLAKYNKILNCTKKEDDVENKLKYLFEHFPIKKVLIEAVDNSQKTQNTKELLLAVYNGTPTPTKQLESRNLRDKLHKEIKGFRELIDSYFENGSEEYKQYLSGKIQAHLNRASAFTAFKRWIIKENARLAEEFGKYID